MSILHTWSIVFVFVSFVRPGIGGNWIPQETHRIRRISQRLIGHGIFSEFGKIDISWVSSQRLCCVSIFEAHACERLSAKWSTLLGYDKCQVTVWHNLNKSSSRLFALLVLQRCSSLLCSGIWDMLAVSGLAHGRLVFTTQESLLQSSAQLSNSGLMSLCRIWPR